MAELRPRGRDPYQEAEEFIIKEGGRRNMDDDELQNVVIQLIKLHSDWGHKRLGQLAGVSHMTIKRARDRMNAAAEKAKLEASNAETKRKAKYDALVRAWGDADDEAQEPFVREYKIDLADLLRLG